MEDIVKSPGLQHIIKTTLTFLDKSDIASFRLVNQNCKSIVNDPIFFLKKLSQLKDTPKDLIENWMKTIQNLQNVSEEIKQEITNELIKMFFSTNAKYPLDLVYKLAETESNPELITAILEHSDPKSYVKATKNLIGNVKLLSINN